MLLEVDDKFYSEILVMSDFLNVTPSEYIEMRCGHKESLRSVLQDERVEFQFFLEEYKTLLEDLFPMTNELSKHLRGLDYSPGMENVFKRLTTLVGEDLSFLSKLYSVYKDNKTVNPGGV